MGINADTLALVEFFRARIDEEETMAKAASGGTVIGDPGNWRPAPGGDEWEVSADVTHDDFGPEGVIELLVALRPGVPRPPKVMSGCWGVVISWEPDLSDSDAWVPEPQFRHIARHDPASALRDAEADRKLLRELEAAAGNVGGDWSEAEGGYADGLDAGLLLAVKIRAERFSAHPDYKPGWVPIA